MGGLWPAQDHGVSDARQALAAPSPLERSPQPETRSGPSLREQAEVLTRICSRALADADGRGYSGIQFVVENRGTSLRPTYMEKRLPRKELPLETKILSEPEAARLLRAFMMTASELGPGAWGVEFKRDDHDHMQLDNWRKLDQIPASPKFAETSGEPVRKGECVPLDSFH
jgi:hypothetical protein